MAYVKQAWTDRQVERPLTFIRTENSDGTITLEPSPGTVTEAGTLVTAERMNHIEDGIKTLDVTVNALGGSVEEVKAEVAGLTKLEYSVITGQINLAKGDTSLSGALDVAYPEGYNGDNCICIAVGINGSASSDFVNYYTYEYLDDSSASYMSGAIRRKVTLAKDVIKLKVSLITSPVPDSQTRKYKIVLMKVN